MKVKYTKPLEDRGWAVDIHQTEGTTEPVSGVEVPWAVTAHGPLGSVPPWVAPDTEEHLQDITVSITAVYDAVKGHYVLRGMTVTADADADAEVTGALIRDLAPLRLLRWVLPHTFTTDVWWTSRHIMEFINIGDDYTTYLGEPMGEDDNPEASASLQDAAAVYRLAEIVRAPPAKAVADALHLQIRTATNWIRRAKQQDLLS